MDSPFHYVFEDISKQNFIAEFFNKNPVLIKGRAGKFDHIFSLKDFNSVLNNSPLEYPRARVTNHLNTIHKYDLIDDKDRYENNINNKLNPSKVMLAIANGGTLVVDRIHQYIENLENFIDSFSNELNIRMSVNGYYTSAFQDGVNIHFDRHDVLAIQIHGSKRWFFRKDDHVLSKPMRRQPVPKFDNQDHEWESVFLEAGDAFYCPRGIWHFTRTGNQPSAHLAIGLYPLTISDWLDQIRSNPVVANALEQYVCEPFHKNGASIQSEPVEKLLEIIALSIDKPFSVGLKPRTYIELE